MSAEDVELLRSLLARTLGLGSEPAERVLDELSLPGVARFVQSGRCRRVVCMVGAGISTAAGIPDFRSPGTGLYANLARYELPYPEAIFDIAYFKEHPEPFFALAKELLPGQLKPTVCHYFMRLLKEKGLLLRCYTQNIDTLERVAGLEPEELVEAHGTFFTSHCTRASCRQPYGLHWMKAAMPPVAPGPPPPPPPPRRRLGARRSGSALARYVSVPAGVLPPEPVRGCVGDPAPAAAQSSRHCAPPASTLHPRLCAVGTPRPSPPTVPW
ncbi:NAD-dependent protein deacetylase sirtuin-2 [Cygnus olor]|uniref:NAD-dependent protein deacetylase sirtuin-2 n=1 Tax=Cygnus olor TaxID=8869 RepID=UPI001ADE3BEA|nr:NAD-dependent protein deacetylase sirtuin-2 [Cygnus olor]